jgi:hypothetical protein
VGPCVVTDSAIQGLEIAWPLPELQTDSGGEGKRPEPSAGRVAAVPCASAPDMDESDFVTSFAAQPLEIMGSLPKLQPAPDVRGHPREAASAPFACHPRESGGPEAAAATLQTERLNLDARFREHDTVDFDAKASTGANAAVCESDFVTGFAAQAIEIMGSPPELQPAAEDGGRACEAASAPVACPPRESGGKAGARKPPARGFGRSGWTRARAFLLGARRRPLIERSWSVAPRFDQQSRCGRA